MIALHNCTRTSQLDLVTETKIPLGGSETRINDVQLQRVLYEVLLGDTRPSPVTPVIAAIITSVIVHNFLGPEMNLHENCVSVQTGGQ